MKRPTLARYNEMVWAVIGTGLLAAAAVGLIGAVAVLIYNATKDDAGTVKIDVIDHVEPSGAQPKAGRYDFCQPIAVHQSPYQLIQVVSDRLVVRNVTARVKQAASRDYSAEAGIYQACGLFGSAEPAAVVNVLIRHAETKEIRLALKENAVVRALEYPQPDPLPAQAWNAFPPKGVLYWEIAADDGNRDGVVDDEDDVGAFLSDLDGNNMARITPTPSRVLEKTYDKQRNVLLLRILPDTNGDGRLSDDDRPALIESSVTHRKVMREVLDHKALSKVVSAAEPKRSSGQRQ